MSAPPKHYKSHPLQPHGARRLRATAHDAAAALYDDMSHAAVHDAHTTSPVLTSTRASPPTVRHAEGLSSSPPPSHPTISPLMPAMATTRGFSAASSPSNSLNTSNTAHSSATAAPANPFFYVRAISSVGGARGVGQEWTSTAGGLTYHHAMHNPSSSAAAEPESSNSSVGRTTPALATSITSSAAAGNATNAANSYSGNSSSLATPPTIQRGAANQSASAPIYVRHSSSSMSTTAPWLRLHHQSNSSNNNNASVLAGVNAGGGSNLSSNMINLNTTSNLAGGGGFPGSPGLGAGGGRKSSAGAACSFPGATVAAAAPVAGAGLVTPKQGTTSASASALPGTPLASLELGRATTADDDAARVCQLCQNLNCACGRGGGTGEGGFSELNGGGAGGGSWGSSVGVHHHHHQQQQQQQMFHLLASPAAAAAETIVPLSLVPPFRTARVEAGVYRGAYPVLRNFPYLRRLRLRTIVSLIPEAPTYDLKCFAEAEHIQLHHIHAERAKGEVQLLPSELSEALQLIMNVDLHPLYLHCLDGRHVTGLVVMGVRKLQQWDLKSAHAEYLRFTGEEQDEVSFIADYTGPLLVPPHIPAWLWGGSLYDLTTGQPKKLQPASMRLRLTTTLTGGLASPASSTTSAGFPAAAGPGGVAAAAAAALSAGVSAAQTSRSGSPLASGGDARPHASAPWMTVPNAEVVAADGQHYVDVDRLSGAAAVYRSAAAGYRNTPMLFSFEYAAGGARGTSLAAGTQSSNRRGGSGSHSASHTTPLQHQVSHNIHNTNSRPSSQSSSTNGSMAGLPAAAAAVLATAARGTMSNPRSPSPSSKWGMAASLDVPQPHHAAYPMQPPSPMATGAPTAATQHQQRASPTPSNGSNGTTDTVTSSLFDNQLSALLWTSGLTLPPSASTSRKNAPASATGVVTSGAGGRVGAGGHSGGVGSSGIGGSSGSGAGGAGVVGSSASVALNTRRAAEGRGAGAGSSSSAAKRSFSR